MKMKNKIYDILMIVGLLILACLLFGLPLQILWNLLMPELFSLPYITFWQACGLQLMAALLFKSNINIKSK
jgi:hypothetical protein